MAWHADEGVSRSRTIAPRAKRIKRRMTPGRRPESFAFLKLVSFGEGSTPGRLRCIGAMAPLSVPLWLWLLKSGGGARLCRAPVLGARSGIGDGPCARLALRVADRIWRRARAQHARGQGCAMASTTNVKAAEEARDRPSSSRNLTLARCGPTTRPEGAQGKGRAMFRMMRQFLHFRVGTRVAAFGG